MSAAQGGRPSRRDGQRAGRPAADPSHRSRVPDEPAATGTPYGKSGASGQSNGPDANRIDWDLVSWTTVDLAMTASVVILGGVAVACIAKEVWKAIRE